LGWTQASHFSSASTSFWIGSSVRVAGEVLTVEAIQGPSLPGPVELIVTPITWRRSRVCDAASDDDERWRLELSRAPGALRGFPVVAKTNEDRLAELVVGRPLGEGNLRHELGAGPGDTRLPGRRAKR
jgi:hypothetical protein